MWCLYPSIKSPSQFLLNPKSTYSISINTPSLTNPYLGTGPRSEVSSESHKCPYQSIVFSNLWSRIKTQEAAKHFYLLLLRHPKHHLDFSWCTLFVLGTVEAATSNDCHVLGGALTHLYWSREPPPVPASSSIPQLSSAHPEQLPALLCAWDPQPKPLSLSTQIYKKNVYLKCLEHWFFWGFSAKISLALKTRLGHGNTKLLVSLTVDRKTKKTTRLLLCREKQAGAKDKESSCCFLKHWFEPALHLK